MEHKNSRASTPGFLTSPAEPPARRQRRWFLPEPRPSVPADGVPRDAPPGLFSVKDEPNEERRRRSAEE